MAKINQIEKLARAYVKNCSDEIAAIREVVTNAKDWTDAKCRKHYLSVYEKEPQFWRYVATYQEEVKKHVAMEAADIIRHWERVAQADVSDIVQIKTLRIACKHCWSLTPHKDIPDPNCDHCKGEGVPYQTILLTDTDKLTDDAKLLYDGAEWTKHGIKVHMRSRDKALDNLAKAKGLFIEKVQVLPPPPLPPLPDDPTEASTVYSNWVKGIA